MASFDKLPQSLSVCYCVIGRQVISLTSRETRFIASGKNAATLIFICLCERYSISNEVESLYVYESQYTDTVNYLTFVCLLNFAFYMEYQLNVLLHQVNINFIS